MGFTTPTGYNGLATANGFSGSGCYRTRKPPDHPHKPWDISSSLVWI